LLAREEIRQSVIAFMADAQLDALIYATFDHQTTLIAPDALSNPNTNDAYGRGNNRRLSPITAFPAITVPAGFTVDGLPVGIEMLGRAFSEGMLLGFAYAYEQSTQHRQLPNTTPSLE
jgi:Asp-tRNA(Asn)/Glu-tRNA(Gln) amidotransferase A subunit family amidase